MIPSRARRRSKNWREFREEEQCSHSCTFSMPSHRPTCGMTRTGQCTQSFTAKEESKEIFLMPLLFPMGQHPAMGAFQRRCPGHVVMAFLDDIYLVSKPDDVREGYLSMERELWRHAKIRVHEGKTHIWNLVGTKPGICDELQRMAELAQPGARVWRGSEVPTQEQGIKVLGALVGHRDFIRRHL